jgi:hypothetical protein
MRRRYFLCAATAFAAGGFTLVGCSTSGETDMPRRQSIDAEVDQTLATFLNGARLA